MEQLTKLRPDRDLQCYFHRPSAAAALSEASASGFTVSGSWRQQFDWVVVEWNRDNVFEHPALRNLPDGDLSGLHLTYEEARTNCIAPDSNLYPTVEWPYLRIWAESNGVEALYEVSLKSHATATGGSYTAATAQFELEGTPVAGDYIELAWLDQHFNYQIAAGDTLESAAGALAAIIAMNQGTGGVSASAEGARIVLTWFGAPGSNGNRIGVYGTVHGAGTGSWAPWWSTFSGGISPERWRVDLDFSNLRDMNGALVPTARVRKMRWTWAADLQAGDFASGEFAVVVTNWTVTGTNLLYAVAGPGSRRIEDDAPEVSYAGAWTEERGNYSGGSIRWTATAGAQLRCCYTAGAAHSLYLGTRRADAGGRITVQVDANPSVTLDLSLSGEDVLLRVPLGQMAGQGHAVTITHTGSPGSYFYFDFLEIAIPSNALPSFGTVATTTLATDWDTDHSIAIAPERTAWLLHTLGFRGRANHYAGALWFYELCRPGHRYAWGTVTFAGAPEFGSTTQIVVGQSPITHVNLIGDTAESVAKCFELLINGGSTGVWARAEDTTLTITARAMGTEGDGIGLSASTGNTGFSATASGPALASGVDGRWQTDLTAMPRMNRAARDWSRSYSRALQGYGIAVAAGFSMELQHGDDSVSAGIAQRYPNGDPTWLNTPALQTNFGPASTAFWKQAYADLAGVMAEAGTPPYLQFGEVQWWYFAAASGMPFYDGYTTSSFQAAYGRPMTVIPSQNADPGPLAEECAWLPKLIGEFTKAIADFVRQSHPDARFEVLYPPDVNDTPLNKIINFPGSYWTPANLACLKTENFTYTGDRDLDKARDSIQMPMQNGFPPSQASHLVGIGEYTTPWQKEQRLALGAGVESIVLFALDQFCLIGYALPLARGSRRALFMGR